MEKILLNTAEDTKKAVSFFGKEWSTEIHEAINEYPCVLLGCFAEDVEFGDIYHFSTVSMKEFESDISGKVYSS